MPELGAVRRVGDKILVYMRRPSPGPIPILGGMWIQVYPLAVPGLDDIAEGTIIDPDALLRHGMVIVVREAPHKMDDATLEALDREAQAMEETG